MIMAKNPNGTYSQAGFIKDSDGNDVEYVKDKNGIVIFEKGFPREKSGTLPLQLDGIGKPLKNYTIYGNTVQNGIPTPNNPVEVQAVGDYDTATEKYKILITTESEDGTESITTPIYLNKPLYKIGDYASSLAYAEQKAERLVKELVLTGTENYNILTGSNAYGIITFYIEQLHFVSTDMPIGWCSHFPESNESYQTVKIESFGLSNKDRIYIRVSNTRIKTKEELAQWIGEQYNNGTPVKVYYILTIPETESVTLPKIPTLDGTTVIDVETTIKPSKMDIKYKSKT